MFSAFFAHVPMMNSCWNWEMHIYWQYCAPDFVVGRRQADGQCDALDNVLLGNLGSCHSLEWYFMYHWPNQVQPFITLVFSKSSGDFFIKVMFPVTLQKLFPWPLYSTDINLIKPLWHVLDKQVQSMEAPPQNLQNLKALLLMLWCQIPQHPISGFVTSMPMGQDWCAGARDLQNIKKVVMFWLVLNYLMQTVCILSH